MFNIYTNNKFLFFLGALTFISGDAFCATITVFHSVDSLPNWLKILIGLSLIGALYTSIFGFNSNSVNAPPKEIKPLGQKKEMTESSFDGARNTSSDEYKIFLTKKYKIEKNQTLEKYIVYRKLFDTLDEALNYCDQIDRSHSESTKIEENLSSAALECLVMLSELGYHVKQVRENAWDISSRSTTRVSYVRSLTQLQEFTRQANIDREK